MLVFCLQILVYINSGDTEGPCWNEPSQQTAVKTRNIQQAIFYEMLFDTNRFYNTSLSVCGSGLT